MTNAFISRGRQGGKTTELLAQRKPDMYYVVTKNVAAEYRNADIAWNVFNTTSGEVKLMHGTKLIASKD